MLSPPEPVGRRMREAPACPEREPRQYCRLYRQYCTGRVEDMQAPMPIPDMLAHRLTPLHLVAPA